MRMGNIVENDVDHKKINNPFNLIQKYLTM
jgi:hypothetical protein